MKKMSREKVREDLIKKHNHSWYEDVYMRNKDRKNKVALTFRGTKITYGEYLNELVPQYARALKQCGIKKGDEFVACVRQTPDYPILFGAATLIGAVVNFIAPGFDEDYLAKIMNESKSNLVFVNDWDFKTLAPALSKVSDKQIVISPVSKYDKFNNPNSDITDKFYKFNEDEYRLALNEILHQGRNEIIDVDKFLDDGKNYVGELNGHGKLDDRVAITYTSGSTKKGVHKGTVQRNSAYITMGRYHDPEVAGLPKMDNTITYASIGTQADTTLMSGVSDTLIQGGILALDPIIDEDYFLHGLRINKGGLCIATRTFWINAMKKTYMENIDIKLPYMYVPSEGGEPLSPGEEKALNKWLRNVKAGIAITHTPISIVKMSVGGGDSEHGSIFLTLFRDYQNQLQKIRRIHEPIGMGCYKFAEVKALREDGTYCEPMELGRLVANSETSMEEYHNDKEATEKYHITDAYGKVWGDLSNYGYIDKWDNVYVKGRIGLDDPIIKKFQIADEILRDTKNIMSCEVVLGNDDINNPIYIAHIETQLNATNIMKILLSAEQRCYGKYGDKLKGNLYFRVRNHTEGFPASYTTKRNTLLLKEEGLSEACIIPSEYYKEK